MNADPLSTWLGFLVSPAAPKIAMSPIELDGYLTGIVVAPELILPSRWITALWGESEPIFNAADQLQTVIGAVMDRYNALIAAMDDALGKLETEQPHAYRPLFLSSGDKPKHETVRVWVRGFWKAMSLAPEGWRSLIEDERMRVLLAPIIGFLDIKDPLFNPADDIDELLDDAAAAIPQTVIVLHKLAQICQDKNRRPTPRRDRIGRNAPCPCGSGQKYKRCCGAS
jgi:uncharacterized protein